MIFYTWQSQVIFAWKELLNTGKERRAPTGSQNGDINSLSTKNSSMFKMYQSTKSWSIGNNLINDVELYTVSEIKSLLELTSFKQTDFCCKVTNGDYGANPFCVIDAYIEKDVLKVRMDRSVKGSVRFNFIFSYKK